MEFINSLKFIILANVKHIAPDVKPGGLILVF